MDSERENVGVGLELLLEEIQLDDEAEGVELLLIVLLIVTVVDRQEEEEKEFVTQAEIVCEGDTVKEELVENVALEVGDID